MPRTPTELVARHRRDADRARQTLDASLRDQNVELAALNYWAILEGYLMAALLTWRHELGSPSADLQCALKAIRQATSRLARLEAPSDVWRQLPLGPAGFLSLLLEGQVDHAMLAQKPVLGAAPRPTEVPIDPHLDRELLVAIETGARSPEWAVLHAAITGIARYSLLDATYSTYLSIVEAGAADRVADVVDAASRSAALFSARSRDPYFAGGLSTNGGGPYNAHVVDYRLAALIHRYIPGQTSILPEGVRLHARRW